MTDDDYRDWRDRYRVLEEFTARMSSDMLRLTRILSPRPGQGLVDRAEEVMRERTFKRPDP